MLLLKAEHEIKEKLIELEFFKENGSFKSGSKADKVTSCPSVKGLMPPPLNQIS